MSRLKACRQPELRPVQAARRRRREAGIAVEPAGRRRSCRTACSTASRRTPGASPAPRRRWRRGPARSRTRRPRAARAFIVDAQPRPTPRRSDAQPQPHLGGLAGGDVEPVAQRAFVPVRAGLTVGAPETTWSLIPSFGYGGPASSTDGAVLVSLSQNSGSAVPSPASTIVPSSSWVATRLPSRSTIDGRWRRRAPGPAVAEPQRRQQLERRVLGPGVADLDAQADIVGRRLGVVDRHVPVAAVVEHAGVDQLVLGASRSRRAFSAISWAYGNSACGYA